MISVFLPQRHAEASGTPVGTWMGGGGKPLTSAQQTCSAGDVLVPPLSPRAGLRLYWWRNHPIPSLFSLDLLTASSK